MEKSDGSSLDVELLRPVEWIFVQSLERAAEIEDPTFGLPRPLTITEGELALAEIVLGKELLLDLPELGASGPATVLAVLPCPEIETAREPGLRVITGTFHHSAANVIDLQIDGESAPIGTTDNHPFWSEDRQAFVEAGQLNIGEHLLLANNTHTQVTRITPHTGPPVAVYNLEVDADHTYHVGSTGVLVHNAYHHYWTKWLGSDVPYGQGSGILTSLKRLPHQRLHNSLRSFLNANHPHLVPGPGRSGALITSTTRLRDRLSALDSFYSTYQGGRHYSAYSQEVLNTMLNGLWH